MKTMLKKVNYNRQPPKWWLSVKTPGTHVSTSYHVFLKTQIINIVIEGKLAFSFGPNEKWVHVIAQCLANNNVPLVQITSQSLTK